MKVRITKAYLVEVTDDKGKAITDDYCFGTKADAQKLGEKLMKEVEEGKNKKAAPLVLIDGKIYREVT